MENCIFLTTNVSLYLSNSLKMQDLRKAGKGAHLSMGTAIGVGIQALEAIEDLHNIGYLHRFGIHICGFSDVEILHS